MQRAIAFALHRGAHLSLVVAYQKKLLLSSRRSQSAHGNSSQHVSTNKALRHLTLFAAIRQFYVLKSAILRAQRSRLKRNRVKNRLMTAVALTVRLSTISTSLSSR